VDGDAVLPVCHRTCGRWCRWMGGRFANSDLNDLYRGHSTHNRLRGCWNCRRDIIVRHEKRMLQEASMRCSTTPFAAGDHRHQPPAAEVAGDMIKASRGVFRQNLLGKRVDYSALSHRGRPTLRLHQCGLPKKMALELFKPFIFHKPAIRGDRLDHPRRPSAWSNARAPEVWDISKR